MKNFQRPDFKDGIIELRFEENEICIYATKAGLEKLAEYCKQLIKEPHKGHIHLEDYDVLTSTSLKGNIAIFDTNI